MFANLGALYGEEKSDHGREPDERVEDHRKMFRGDIGRLFAGLAALVDSNPYGNTNNNTTGTSRQSSVNRHVVVWQETASQHWHNIPPSAPTNTAASTTTAKSKGKRKGKAGEGGGNGGGVPSSYDFTWTASGYDTTPE